MSEDPVRVEGISPARAGEAARQLVRRTRLLERGILWLRKGYLSAHENSCPYFRCIALVCR